MAMMFFYKSPDGLEHGPADLAEMKMRIENGSISVLTMVRWLLHIPAEFPPHEFGADHESPSGIQNPVGAPASGTASFNSASLP